MDLDSFRKCLQFMKDDVKCQGVTIAGVLGEANRLTEFEKQLLIQTAVEETKNELEETPMTSNQEFAICVGVAHPGKAATVDLCHMATELGANAVMVSPSKDSLAAPPPSEDSIFDLIQSIGEMCPSTTIVLQDLPSVSGVHTSIDLMANLVANIPQVTTIKLESTPTMSRIATFRQTIDMERSTYSLLTGLGALYAGFDLCPVHSIRPDDTSAAHCPTDGFMTGFAFPEVLLAMINCANRQEFEKVRKIYETYLPLMVLEQQPGEGLQLRKEIYKQRGLIAASKVRQPGKVLSPGLESVSVGLIEDLFTSRGIAIEKVIPLGEILSSI